MQYFADLPTKFLFGCLLSKFAVITPPPRYLYIILITQCSVLYFPAAYMVTVTLASIRTRILSNISLHFLTGPASRSSSLHV